MRQNLLTYLNQVQALFLLLRDQSGCSRTIPTRQADHNEGLALSWRKKKLRNVFHFRSAYTSEIITLRARRFKIAFVVIISFLLWFFTGMLEPADSEGGALGKTFQCLLADQFKRLREGDRFWHENAPNRIKNTDKTAFTRCQLQEIRKVTLAKIICDNAENIPSIPRRVLQQSKTFVDCNKLPIMNLDVFTPNFRCPWHIRYVCKYHWRESNFTLIPLNFD